MVEQKIEIRVTETDMTMQVVVFSKSPDKIEVVYEHSRKQVQEDVELENHDYRDSRRR